MFFEDISLYLLVFFIVLLPPVMYQSFQNYSKKNNINELGEVPGVFKYPYVLIEIINGTGLSHLLVSVFTGKKQNYIKLATIANAKLTPEIIFSAQLFYSFLVAIVAAVWFFILPLERFWITFAFVFGLIFGWIIPSTALASAADKRQNEIIRGLPFAIDLISSAMRSGLDFGAAIRYYVSLGTGSALGVEFGIMLRQIELGKTRVEALNNMAERIASKEFTSFVASVAHGTEIGASIVDTMNIQGEEMRRARFNLAERKAARAPSLMILPMAIFILPAVFIIIFTPVYLKIQASGMSFLFK